MYTQLLARLKSQNISKKIQRTTPILIFCENSFFATCAHQVSQRMNGFTESFTYEHKTTDFRVEFFDSNHTQE